MFTSMGLEQEKQIGIDAPLDLVTIFESNDTATVSLVTGSLEDSGIPFWEQGDETAARLALGPIMFPSTRFLVARDRAVEAKEVLAPFLP